MKTNNTFFKRLTKLGFLFVVGLSMVACAGVSSLDGSTTAWKEEVQLHDGQKIIVKRIVVRGGRHEIGQKSNSIYESLTFNLLASNKTIKWEDKKTEDIGNSNFRPLLLDIVDNTPYLVTNPMGCLSYNKWGRPNPPYIIFKYEADSWKRITVQELPIQLSTPNLIVNSADTVAAKADSNLITAGTIKTLNSSLIHLQYRTILREPVQKGEGIGSCPELVFYKGAWIGPGDSIGKRMMDSRDKKLNKGDSK